MILAFDTGYFGDRAKTVCIVFGNWSASAPYKVYAEVSESVAAYVPGQFYRRELPGIMTLWQQVEEHDLEAVLIDGFVYLDDEGLPGLGAHLYEQLGGTIPVIGVAKNDYATIRHNKRLVWRGGSKRPLYVTAVGMDTDTAARHIESMAVAFRIPALLKKLDRLTKQL